MFFSRSYAKKAFFFWSIRNRAVAPANCQEAFVFFRQFSHDVTQTNLLSVFVFRVCTVILEKNRPFQIQNQFSSNQNYISSLTVVTLFKTFSLK